MNFVETFSIISDPVYQAVDRFFKCYFTERDIEKTLALVTEDVFSVGTGVDEIALNKNELRKILISEFSSLPNPIHYNITEFKSKHTGCCAAECFCKFDIRTQMKDGDYVSNSIRLTVTFIKEGERLLANTFHASAACTCQPKDEFFPVRYGSDSSGNSELNWKSQHEIAELICQTIPGGILGVYVSEGNPVYMVNDVLLKMLGYSYEEFICLTGGNIINIVHTDDRNGVIEKISSAISRNVQYDLEMRIQRKDGTYLWVYSIGRKIDVTDGRKAVISVIVDFSENIKRLSSLEEENLRDPLTGLYNRKGGEKNISGFLHDKAPYIFVMMDIDNFKAVNDTYGHYEGDKILKFVSELLNNTFRKTDIIVRIGGDEFGIFIRHCTDSAAIQKKIDGIIEDYKEMIKREYPKSDSSISFGGVMVNESVSFVSLYKAADKVLYGVKSTQKGVCIIKPIQSLGESV